MVNISEHKRLLTLVLLVVLVGSITGPLAPPNVQARVQYERLDSIPGGSDGKPWDWDSPNPGTSFSVPIHSQVHWWQNLGSALTPFLLWWF